MPLMARKAKLIITPSELVKNQVCEHLRIQVEKVFAVPLAPRSSFKPITFSDTLATRKRLDVEDQFLLFVGTVEPRKNLLTLVQALEEVLRTTELRPQLVLAGKIGWKADDVLLTLSRSPIRDRVRRLGFVSDEDLRELYSSCTAFIYPSIYEGFGLPPLEAMACGAPVIASQVPSIKKSVARIVSATDSKDLARNVIELLQDEHARQSLSIRGLEYAQAFSWQRTAALTREVYAQALR
jgi:glycosyltransferase involved in cell wall biosynthesis